MRVDRWRLAQIGIGLAFLVYAGVFIWQSSFVIDGTRYFSLFDDPMISMRYAHNLASGYGAVWNPGGDPVEGFSNPLWVGVMALVHLVGVPIPYTSLVLQILGAILLAANLVLVGAIADVLSGRNGLVGLAAVVLTAFYYPLNNWGLLGNDVAPAVLLVNLAVWLALRGNLERRFHPAAYVVLAIATFLRMDLSLAYVVVLAYLAGTDRINRRAHLVWGGGILLAAIAIQTGWRLATYGEVLPNTYYLKMVGGSVLLRIVRGAFVLVKFAWNFGPPLFVLPFLVLPIRRDQRDTLVLGLVAVFLAYSVYIGGDAWEHRGGANRFISTVMPLLFVGLALSLEEIRHALATRFSLVGRWRPVGSRTALLGVTLIALINANAVLDTSSLRAAFLIGDPLYVAGNRRNTSIGLFLRELTGEQARIAYVAAGAAPYFAGREAIDLLGKSDRRIAAGPMQEPPDLALIDYRPGHMKWDYAYSIGELRPDVIVEIWQGRYAEAAPFLEAYVEARFPDLTGFLPDGRMFFRRGSPQVRWEAVTPYLVVEGVSP